MIRHIKLSLLWILSLVIIAAVVQTLPGTISVSTNVTGTELPIAGTEHSDQKLALTFNAAGSDAGLSRLLQTLDKHQIHATFFLTGDWVSRYSNETVLISQYGHELGILGDTYLDFTNLEKTSISAQLTASRDKIANLTGISPHFFRPPYNAYNNLVIRTARDAGYQTISWSVDSMDWKDYGVSAIENKVIHNPDLSGAILYFHTDAKYTPEALESLIPLLLENGYSFASLSDLLYEENYHLDTNGRQIPDE